MPGQRLSRLRHGFSWAALAALCALAVIATLALAERDLVLGIGLFAGLIFVLILVLPSRHNTSWKMLVALLAAFAFGGLLPGAVSGAVQSVVLVLGYIIWLAQPVADRRGSIAVLLSALILAYWALLIFHPNVPSVEVGILGFRKTVLCAAGVALGAGIPGHLARATEKAVVAILAAVLCVSIAVHLFFPSLEQMVSRDAGEYTGLYGGEARLQGILAGPFHIALAGLILVTWGFVRWSLYRSFSTFAIVIGMAAITLTLVRTAWVVLLMVALVGALLARTASAAIKRIAVGGVLGVVLLSGVLASNPELARLLDSILAYDSDSRFLGRLPGYSLGLALFSQSPIFGWGSGSAGDTLGADFSAGQHITSHNIVLKIAVEGGLIGICLWIALVISIVIYLPRKSAERTLAICVLSCLAGLGMTVASLETLPVSYFAFALVGLCLGRRQPSDGLDRPRAAQTARAGQE